MFQTSITSDQEIVPKSTSKEVRLGSWHDNGHQAPLEGQLPRELIRELEQFQQDSIPRLARSKAHLEIIREALWHVPTRHLIRETDSRVFEDIPDESVHLVLTSPPYWTLKAYPPREGQLAEVEDYEEFNQQLAAVWKEALRVLVPGGRLVVVVGDVNLARRRYGRHVVMPLHATIQEECRRLGLDNLAPIIWQKISNASYETGRSSNFLGKPYEPNAIIKNDIEYILFQRKPGGYRQPSVAARLLSVIPYESHQLWFRQVWSDVNGASTRDHPAPYPVQLADRLIRMFSFVGDTVLDPFLGTGTTSVAAALVGRNSIGFEIEPAFADMAFDRLRTLTSQRRLPTDLASAY